MLGRRLGTKRGGVRVGQDASVAVVAGGGLVGHCSAFGLHQHEDAPPSPPVGRATTTSSNYVHVLHASF